MFFKKMFSISRAEHACEFDTSSMRLCFYAWNIVFFVLSALGVCLISLTLALGMYEPKIFFGYFKVPLIFVLNFLPVLLLQAVLMCLFNRQWLAFLLSAFPVLAASIGNFYALKLRGQPFSYSLIREVPTALRIASNYDLTPNSRILLAIAAIVIGTLFFFFLCRGRLRLSFRITALVFCLLSLVPLWQFVYSNEETYDAKTYNPDHVVLMMPSQVFASKGFVYPFIHSFVGSAESAPAGYDPAVAQQALSQYTDGIIADDKKPHIIAIQLESFSDLESIGVSGIDASVYEKLRSLQQESIHGKLLTNVFGGGTLKSEQCFLTGNWNFPIFTEDYPSYVWYLKSQGYITTGIHPHYGGMYNRKFSNPQLGFDEYFFFEDTFIDVLPDGFFSDHLLYPWLLSKYESIKDSSDETMFSFVVTMQGHGPYESTKLLYEPSWAGFGAEDELYYCLNNYLGGVRDTLDHLSAMIEELRHDEEPVVVLLYGDHLPHISANQDMFQSFGINADINTKEGWYNYYSTPYLIWANEAAKEMYGKDFVGEGEDTSVCYLMNMLFNELEWNGPAFMQLSETVRETIQVAGTNGQFIENGEFTTQLSEDGQKLLDLYKYAQYYLANDQKG